MMVLTNKHVGLLPFDALLALIEDIIHSCFIAECGYLYYTIDGDGVVRPEMGVSQQSMAFSHQQQLVHGLINNYLCIEMWQQ